MGQKQVASTDPVDHSNLETNLQAKHAVSLLSLATVLFDSVGRIAEFPFHGKSTTAECRMLIYKVGEIRLHR